MSQGENRPHGLPKPEEVLQAFLTPEQMQAYKAKQQSGQEVVTSGGASKGKQSPEFAEEMGELLQHMGMLARIIKMGIDGLPTLFYSEELAKKGGSVDAGVVREDWWEECMQVMDAKGKGESVGAKLRELAFRKRHGQAPGRVRGGGAPPPDNVSSEQP